MINPDGVILGNFRTGLAGKDLNRQFKNKNLGLLPEIRSLKDYVNKLKASSTSNLVYFLDFHGHSSKKNVFVYGPEYEVWDQKYERSRILPKMISKNT
jgi:cytosolic carboxypeptidase protein 2/3